MALIVEDGSGVANANSYTSIAEYRAWATARGLSLPPDDVPGNLEIEQATYKAMDYLEIKPCYGGEQTDEEQSLSFPRTGLYIKGRLITDDKIPAPLKTAEYFLINAVLNGIDLMPNVSGIASDYVIKEKVGPIETEYANPVNYDGQTTLTAVDNLLALLSGGCSGALSFDVVRG